MRSSDNSKKQILKRIAKIASLLVAIAIIAGLFQHYVMCRMDAHQRRMEGFYLEEKDSLDMVFIGSSEIYNDFIPALAYENYGISSYLYGFQADPSSMWGYQLKEIERTQNPDVLIIECNGAGYSQKELDDPAAVRFMTDDMPLSLNKIQLINDKATEGKLSYYFPMLKYHTQLIPGGGTLNKYLLEKRGFHILRGGQARISRDGIKQEDIIDVSNDTSVADLDPAGEQYLREFLEQCQESSIKHIVFVRFPHVVTDANYLRFQRYHRAEEIIKEYGFDYIDFDRYKSEMNVEDIEDFLDVEHMNLYGAEKLTNYLVPYMMEQYNIQPRVQSEKAVEQWNQSIEYYHNLAEYWSYFIETYPEIVTDEYDLNDSYDSQKSIEAYIEGNPIEPGKEEKSTLQKLKIMLGIG